MTKQILIPSLGESVTSATLAKWLKTEGEAVHEDERIAELETDKVTLEINAPATGVLKTIKVPVGNLVKMGELIGEIEEGAAPKTSAADKKEDKAIEPEPLPAEASPLPSAPKSPSAADKSGPAAQKLMAEAQITPSQIAGTGKDGRITKGDVQNFVKTPEPAPSTPQPLQAQEERVPMTTLRRRIAERLKEAQNTAAMLTTFNEIDMTHVMAARAQHQEVFEKKYGVRLGFMSFFTKASILALKEIPAINAEIRGEDIIYKNHYDIGIAVSTPQGLVVPVVRGADQLSFAGIEKTIVDLGERARAGKLALSDLSGGTFTITNGGVFGSLLSTPILNPPQSGILGLHKIEKRPVVIQDKIEIRSMMYVALTYDHRIIDGREAVTFLVRVKECLENPERLLLGV